MRKLPLILCAATLCGCAALDPVFDAPVHVADPDTGETVEVPLGDVIADSAAPVADTVGSIVGAVTPVLGLMAAGAVGTLLAGARRKKQPVA